MEFARPPRPRRCVAPPATQQNSFDPVGAVARIWAGLEAEAPNGPTSSGCGRRRASSRSSSRPRSQETENTTSCKSDAEDVAALRAELRTEAAELLRVRAAAANLQEELEQALSEVASAPGELQAAAIEEQRAQLGGQFHEELVHRLSQQSAELQQHFHECLTTEVAEEIAIAKKVWSAASSADAAKERSQQEEFQKQLEVKYIADAQAEVARIKAKLIQEFSEQEEDIKTSCRQRAQEELQQELCRVQTDEAARVAEMSRNEAQYRDEFEAALEQQLQQQAQKHQHDVSRLEDVSEKEIEAKLKLEIGRVEERLEAQAMERLECEGLAVQACREAEELVRHLEDQEAQARHDFQDELACHQAQGVNASKRCAELEELAHSHHSAAEEDLVKKLDDQLASERKLLEEKFETRAEAHLEDCLQTMATREEHAEAQMRAEMTTELATEKEIQVARLQKLMEKRLAEGLAKQKRKASSDEPGSAETGEGVAEALAQREREVAQLRQEVAEARRQKRNGGEGFEDFQSEELQKLLQLAHRENNDLRETVNDLRGEINTQAGEIELLEEKVLGTLSGLRDGGREPMRSLSSAVGGPPRASSMPSKSREPSNTPPSRAQPGDIRRLPPQPKQRLSTNVV